MSSFLRVLARLTLARKKRRPLKDVGIGVGVGVLIAAGGVAKPEWAGWLLLLYFTSVQALAFAENEVFFDFGDLRRLGFRDRTPFYRLAYVTHYVARDATLSNGIALGLGSALLLAAGSGWFALWLIVAYAANLCLLPSHVFLAPRLSNRGRTAYVCLLFGAWAALVAPVLLGGALPGSWLPLAAPATALVVGVHGLAVDVVASRLNSNGLTSFGGRRYVAWLARVSPFLFKDVLLLNGMIIQRLAMGVGLFALLAMGSPRQALPGLALVALGADNLMLGRRGGEFRLLADDNLFSGRVLPADADALRRHKLVALSVDIPIKALVVGGVLLASGQARLELVATILCVLLAGYVVDGPVLYLPGRLGRVLRHAVKYALVAVFVAVTLLGQPVGLAAMAAGAVAGVYLPSLISTYWPKVTSRPDGAGLLAKNSETPPFTHPVSELVRA